MSEGFPWKAKDRAAHIREQCQQLAQAGVPDDALSPILDFANSLVCEGCSNEATSGPHPPDGVYLCDDCSTPTQHEETP